MKTINNVRWLELARYQDKHDTRCRCDTCIGRYHPRIAAAVILTLALACWALVAAVVMGLLT